MTAESESTTNEPITNSGATGVDRAEFDFEVDGAEYEFDRPTIFGAQIMEMSGIPVSEGLVQIFDDGTTLTVLPTTEVHLVPEAQFKKRPRFKRGS